MICERGVNARTDKGRAVKDAGGVGMIMYNPTPNSLNADFQPVPTIHVGTADGAAIKAYAAHGGRDRVDDRGRAQEGPAPQIASFSSSGPSVADRG